MYAPVIRAADGWRRISVGDFEQRQLKVILTRSIAHAKPHRPGRRARDRPPAARKLRRLSEGRRGMRSRSDFKIPISGGRYGRYSDNAGCARHRMRRERLRRTHYVAFARVNGQYTLPIMEWSSAKCCGP